MAGTANVIMAIDRHGVTLVALVFGVGLGLFFATPAAAEPVEFVVLGDMPYGADQVGGLNYIGKTIRRREFPFVIHYGDVKAGDGKCDDATLSARRDLIYGLVPGGVFYTPGDNDWTDCDRPEAGGFDELERLKVLRRLFFATGLPSKPEWGVARQDPDYPENARWMFEDLLFVTLHIVGTDNGRDKILQSDQETALDAVDARDAADLAWLDAAFDEAERRAAPAVVVAMQADPYDLGHRDRRGQPCTRDLRTECNPYLAFLRRLSERADRFDKPVLLVHGSTSNYCLDRGFGGWQAPKLWRLNGPGDFVAIDAAVVRFDPSGALPFEVHGLLTGDPAASCASWPLPG